ncbi:SsrA-binding protein SmpB [Alkalibacterium sp. m-11]|uniref:SsrA-binding protein n=1 Tax=Alkalibacterium indicireducens TaxID=398758 RepID=A0ABP3KDH8_9LACT
MPKGEGKLIAQNRKARYEYTILETIEAGIVLKGTEIKSIRAGRINLKDGYASIRDGEIWLYNVHIAPFEQGNQFNHDPVRPRKLLMKKKEIDSLYGEVKQGGNTLVPLKVYIKNGFAKVLIGLAKGKKQYDKRETIKRREQDRQMRRAIKDNY